MPSQAIITLNENQWTVLLATTYAELTTGLSGVASLAAGTGMLFVLPARQLVTVDTTNMLFPIDIIFIKDDAVLDIASNIQPGYLVEEATPCDMFLEINAGEAAGVEVGDSVSTATIQQPGMDFSQIVSFAIPLVVLGFVCGMAGGMARLAGGSSEVRRLSKPRTEEERARVHKEFYGTEELPLRGKGLEERGELTEGRQLGEPKTEAERRGTHLGKYGVEELPERGMGMGHPSSEEEATFPPEARKDLTFCKHMWDLEKTIGRPFTKGEVAEKWEAWKKLRYRPKTEEERKLSHELKYGAEQLPERGKGLEEHELTPRAIREGTHPYRPPVGIPAKVYPVRASTGEGYSLFDMSEGVWFGRRSDTYEEAVSRADRENRRLWEASQALRGGSSQSQEEETRFIGACKIVDGLCHTHGYSVSKTVKCPKSPLTDEEWAAAWELAEAAYPEGMSNPWVNGWWPETMEEAEGAAREYEWKMRDAIRMFREKQAKAMENYERGADKAAYNYRRYVTAEYETGKEIGAVPSPSGHHSMWLTLEQRKALEKKYGMVAVRWAEEATKPGDIKAAERAAEYYYAKVKEALGLGHLSPELSQEQIRRLREVLGLPKEVPPREKGYID